MKMAIFTLLVLSLAFAEVITAHSSYETVLAEQLDQYCALRHRKRAINQTRSHSIRGKAGIQGPPGRNGERGPPGVVEYDVVAEIVTQKIASFEEAFVNKTRKDEEVPIEGMNEINKKISSMSLTLENMTTRMQLMEEKYSDLLAKLELCGNETKKFQSLCPIFYNNKCFMPVMDKEATLDEARDICAGMSGKLADIYSADHLDLIMKRVRENHMNGESYVRLRLGMSIQPSTGQVSLTDGTKVTYLNKWYSGYPMKTSTYTSIILLVDQSVTNVYQYLYNYPPTKKRNILCEI